MKKEKILAFLREENIPFTYHDHAPIYTIEASRALNLPGEHPKNLFITDRKHRLDALLVVRGEVRPDLKALARSLQLTPMGLASAEHLNRRLNLTPGEISPLELIDAPEDVELWIDDQLPLDNPAAYHPGGNDASVLLETRLLLAALVRQGRRLRMVTVVERP